MDTVMTYIAGALGSNIDDLPSIDDEARSQWAAGALMRMVELYGFPEIAAEIERLNTNANDAGPWTQGDLN
jgi:hypothetical protein